MADTSTRSNAAFYLSFLILSVLRFSYMGFRYTPYLDDYIQYIYYPSFEFPRETILTGGAKILFTRPLAGLMDFYIWSLFKNCFGAAVIIIALLYGISGILFCRAFKGIGINIGYIFLVFFVLCPINFEGTYWISASSRVVISLFLISLSVYFAAKEQMPLFLLFNFLSLWFYEQTAILAFALAVIFCIKKNKPLWILAAAAAFLSLAAFYLFFGKLGDNAHRMSGITISQILPNIKKVFCDTATILGNISPKLIYRGFLRGSIRIFRDFSYLWFILCGIFIVIFSAFSRHENGMPLKSKLILGSILAITPLLPFFITQNNSLNMRNIVPCLFGISIILDGLLPVIFKSATPIFITVCLMVFSLVNASEVYDYEKTAQQDLALAKKISQSITPSSPKVTIKITSPVYFPQNAPYRDHIKSMTGSDWGVTGIVRTVSGIKNAEVIIIVAETAECRFKRNMSRNFQDISLKATHDCNSVGL